MLSEISQSLKDKYSRIPLIGGTYSEFIEIQIDRQHTDGCPGLAGAEMGNYWLTDTVSFLQDAKCSGDGLYNNVNVLNTPELKDG